MLIKLEAAVADAAHFSNAWRLQRNRVSPVCTSCNVTIFPDKKHDIRISNLPWDLLTLLPANTSALLKHDDYFLGAEISNCRTRESTWVNTRWSLHPGVDSRWKLRRQRRAEAEIQVFLTLNERGENTFVFSRIAVVVSIVYPYDAN